MQEIIEVTDAGNYDPFGTGEPSFKEDLVAHVNKEFQRRIKERQSFELQWQLNIAFMEGNQYADVNPATATIVEMPPLYWWQEREIFNHIAPIIETRQARLGRLRPRLFARVPSPGADDSDRNAAIVSTAILGMAYEDMCMLDRLSEALAWLDPTGTILLKYIWNPEAGQHVGGATLHVESDEGAAVFGQSLHEGDLEAIVCPPQEIFPESSWHDGVKATRSIIHAKAYHIDTIRDIWGVSVTPEDTHVSRMQRVAAGTGGAGAGMSYGLDGGTYRYINAKMENHALVKEYWEMPSKRCPKGRLIIVAGEELLYAGCLPYNVGANGKPALPFVRIQAIRRPGCFWGRSIVQRLIPLQRRYNALRNRKAEFLNRCAIGTLVAEEGSADEDALMRDAGAPGTTIWYKRGFTPPRFMQNPQLPQAFLTEERALLDELTIISGVSEMVRQSKAPPGVKSGIAMSIAIEQDDTRLSHTAENIKRELIESGKMWLRMYKQFVQTPRLLRMVGKQNLLPVTHWVGHEIRSENVLVEGVPHLLDSLAQRRQMVFDLLQTGLFNDSATGQLSVHGRSRVLEMLELGDWESYTDAEQLHLDRADRENAVLIRGEMTEPATYDDHMLHIARHNRTRLTVDYEVAVSTNADIAGVFENHIGMHLMSMIQQLPQQQPNVPMADPGSLEPVVEA